jgi:subtilisin family serine protease
MTIALILLSLLSLSLGFVDVTNREYPHVPDEYLITYHLNTTEDDAKAHWGLMATRGVEFIHQYNVGFMKGFAARITDQSVIEQLQHEPIVMAIEMNGIVELFQKTCTGITPTAASWGLARISFDGDVSAGLREAFYYDTGAYSGAGTTVYIIDTGIMETHVDFGGRASWGIAYADGRFADENGHGTHCAGTAVGSSYGVAKAANVVAVKVLGSTGGGTWADVAAGINWVAANGVPFKAVASMSLGGGGSQQLITTAVNNCVARGIPVVVAAGNSNADACGYTPSGIPATICVGASEIAGFSPEEFDARASFSNWGRCLHLFAPGRDITSSWIGSNTASYTISGTSMACPHVAGQAACILSSEDNISPQRVKDLLQQTALPDLIANAGTDSPNLLLNNECHR